MSKTKSRNIHDPAVRSARGSPVDAYLGATAPERRARAEELIARYHSLDADELAELLNWYRRQASSMDMALLASNEAIGEPYRAFRREHVDRFSVRDKLVGALILAAGAAGVGALAGLEFGL